MDRARSEHSPRRSGARPASEFVSLPGHQQLRDREGGARCVVPGAFPGRATPVCRYRQRHSRGFRGGRLPAFGAPDFPAQLADRQPPLLRGKLRGVLGAGEFLSSCVAVSGLLHLGGHFRSAGTDAGLDARELPADHAGSEARVRNGGRRRDLGFDFCRVSLEVGGACVWHGESSVGDGSVYC